MKLSVVAPQLFTSAMLALTIVTACCGAHWRAAGGWQELGWTTLLYVPALILIAADGWAFGRCPPIKLVGMLAWPLALLMHGYLLRNKAPGSCNGSAAKTDACGRRVAVCDSSCGRVALAFAHLGRRQ